MSMTCKKCRRDVIFAQNEAGRWMPPFEPMVLPLDVPVLSKADQDADVVVLMWDKHRGTYRSIVIGAQLSVAKLHKCDSPDPEEHLADQKSLISHTIKTQARVNHEWDLSKVYTKETLVDEMAEVALAQNIDMEKVTAAEVLEETIREAGIGPNGLTIEGKAAIAVELREEMQTRNKFKLDLVRREITKRFGSNANYIGAFYDYLDRPETLDGLDVECPSCHAAPGDWCLNLNTLKTSREGEKYVRHLHPKREELGGKEFKVTLNRAWMKAAGLV